MEGNRVDDLTKAMDAGTESRRRVVSGLLGAAIAGATALAGGEVSAGRGPKPIRCRGDSCDGTGGKECGRRQGCQCYRHAGGGHVCAKNVNVSCDAARCRKDRDCPRGHVCIASGPACCGSGRENNFCLPACRR